MLLDTHTPLLKLLRAAQLQPICGTQQFKEARLAMLRVILPGVDLSHEAALEVPGFTKEALDKMCPPEGWTLDQVEAIAQSVYSYARTDGGMAGALTSLKFFDHGVAALAAQSLPEVAMQALVVEGQRRGDYQ